MNVARSEIFGGLESELNPSPKDPVTSLEETYIEKQGNPSERLFQNAKAQTLAYDSRPQCFDRSDRSI